MASRTPDWLPALDDRTVVVTGANTGLGKAGTDAFVQAGADVVMACRSTDRGGRARDDLLAADPPGTLTVAELDLADLASVEAFAQWYAAEHDSLHILCNNAGVMAIPRRVTADGFEYQIGVNHLGHFALTGWLLDQLIDTPGETRVVTQSSYVHVRGHVDFDDLHGEDEYDKWSAYAQSKLANLLFAFELQRRLDDADVDVVSVGCHPGYADTDLQRRGPEAAGSRVRLWAMRLANRLLAQSAEQGVWPMLHAATETGLDGGEYVGPGGLLNVRGSPALQEPNARARDERTAERLWDVSETLTGVEYDL